jgi:hypothetical protein
MKITIFWHDTLKNEPTVPSKMLLPIYQTHGVNLKKQAYS